MLRKLPFVVMAVVATLVLTSCAPGANAFVGTAGPNGGVAGFWLGLWQGLIAPLTFVLSLFSDGVGVYEVHNNGSWYDFGFMLGVSSVFGGSGSQAKKRRKGDA
jgi:hypothetical protein